MPVPADSGENEVVYCDACGYAANIDKARSAPVILPDAGVANGTPAKPPLEKFATPGVLTIEALTQPPHGIPANRQIKTLVYVVESKMVLLLLRGDQQLNEAKIAGVLGIPEGTVKSRINRGRAELTRLLRKQKLAV